MSADAYEIRLWDHRCNKELRELSGYRLQYGWGLFEMENDRSILPGNEFVRNVSFPIDNDAFILVNEPPHVITRAVEMNFH